MDIVKDSKGFSIDFPEQFNWEMLDSYKLLNVSSRIARQIIKDLSTTERIYTPGLRKALNIIADIAEY